MTVEITIVSLYLKTFHCSSSAVKDVGERALRDQEKQSPRFQRNVVDVLTACGPKRAISRNTIVRITRKARSLRNSSADGFRNSYSVNLSYC